MGDFKRLGVLGKWDHPYLTMSFKAEAQIVRELGKFLMDGSLYKGSKPVMWSPVEKTALAEAEVEYKDISSTAIYVRFPIIQAENEKLIGASVVIWTTTPWTIPGNQAVAYGNDISYGLYAIEVVLDGSLLVPGERIMLAEPLAVAFFKAAGVKSWSQISIIKNADLENVLTQLKHCTHVLAFAAFRLLSERNRDLDLYRLLRTGGGEDSMELSWIYRVMEAVLEEMRHLRDRGELLVARELADAAVTDVVADALRYFASYHNHHVLVRRDGIGFLQAMPRPLLLAELSG